jgi:dTDP-4-dehydrorhamnose 3,5-epimerase-like enzyme
MRTTASYFGGLVSAIELPVFQDDRGSLCPIEFPISGFLPVRAFLVSAVAGAVRGGHGHYKARQLLMQVAGKIEIELRYKGLTQRTVLDSNHRALLIEPGVWAQQYYTGKEPTLIVFSDQPYNQNDYFRELAEDAKLPPSQE